MEKDKTYDDMQKEALANDDLFKATPEAVNEEVLPKEEEVKPESEGIPPEKILEELNKLGFKVKGKSKAISSTDELKRLINLGFNYEENARRLNEERQKLKEAQSQPKEEGETLVDYDEKQKQLEEKIQAIDEYLMKIESKETEKELDEAIAGLKEEFSLTDEEIDMINLELQNRLDLVPPNKEIDLKSLMRAIYLELNPDVFNKKIQSEIDKKVQEELDKYKKSLSKTIVTEGGTSPAVKSGTKTPSSYEEAQRLAMEDEIFKNK